MTDNQMPRYPLEAPPDLWEDWKLTVPRSYDRFGDRLIEFILADLYCRREHGQGMIELLVAEGYLTEDALEREGDG